MTILVLLSLAILQMTRVFSARAAAQAAASQESLAAASGMDYAASRLSRDSMPRFTPTPANRGDDWTERQGSGASGQGPDNPSYSHGESWADDGDGVHGQGEPFADRDGDGRFSAWSGRLRGGRGGGGLRFALKVGSLDGKIPLNAGWLWIDYNGDGTISHPSELVDLDGPPRTFPSWRCGRTDGIPDHNQIDIPYHASLAFVLNNLAARLHHPASGAPLVSTRCWDIPSGADTTGDGVGDGDPLQAAWLGEDLIRNRPPRGYRTWEEVERTLLNLDPAVYPGAPYTKAEVDAIRPYIDLGPYGLPSDSARAEAHEFEFIPNYVPIHLATASREVLEALWRYLSADAPCYRVNTAAKPPPVWEVRLSGDFPGEPAGFSAVCPWSGLKYVDTTDTNPPNGVYRFQRPVIFPVEAARIAQAAIGFRRGTTLGWRELRRVLLAQSASIFLEDAAALTAATPPPHALAGSWCSAKGELAFQSVCEDPTPTKAFLPSSVLATWGVDRDGDAGNGFQPAPTIQFERIQRILYPSTGFTPPPASPDPWPSYGPGEPYWFGGGSLHPQGLTLAPPLRFRILARVGPAGTEGTFFAGERIDFGSQQDFECEFAGARRFWRTGITALDIPATNVRRGAPLGYAPAIVTLPRWNRESLLIPSPGGLDIFDLRGYSRAYGALGLGTMETGPGTAQLYWPLTEDFDDQNRDPLAVPAWREFWSQVQAGAAPWPAPSRQPPYRLYPDWEQLEDSGFPMMHPYGFSSRTGDPWYSGVCRTGGGVHDAWQKWPGQMSPGTVDAMSVEGRFGAGSSMRFAMEFGTLSIAARRAFRLPLAFGTELVIYNDYILVNGLKARKTETWFVPDSATNGAWNHRVLLTFQRFNAGAVNKTRISLYVNGQNDVGYGAMTSVFDGTHQPPPPPFSYYFTECGEIRRGRDSTISHAFMDEIRLYDHLGAPASSPRYVPSGTFLSPLCSLDSRALLSQAQWTGAVPPGGLATVRVVGYRDPWGTDIAGTVTCGPDTVIQDLKEGIPGPVRSFRYEVDLTRSPTVDETPIFESIWVTLQRRGSSPAWTAWQCR